VAAPSSKKKKLLVLGVGVVVVGGVAAYAMSASASAPPLLTGPTGPTVDPRAAKTAECAALQASLVALRAQPTPDAATMVQLEGRISACLAEARTLGAEVDAATTQQAAADAVYAQMEGWFNEYRATSGDPLKRNNTRQSILNGGAGLAATYANAITQSTNPQMTKLIAQSVLRALNAAISRQLCFLGNDRGCGTFGSDEDQPDAKAAQEQSRVITPLIAAYMLAVTKLGGPTQALANADGERFLAIMLRPCTFQKIFIDGQFSHYKATEWSDALKRNNTRRDILADGRSLTASLQSVFALASSFRSAAKMREVGTLTMAAINASIDRWLCFFTGGPGCGTFAVNEDQPDVKAAQERANTLVPLMALYATMSRALFSGGDATAQGLLVTAKLRVCTVLNGAIGAQWSHYTATAWSDALRRNNTRMSILGMERDLVASLRDALSAALSITSHTARVQAVRAVEGVVYTALGASITRWMCFLYSQHGCGTFGVNEDQPDVKAAQEQATSAVPLTAIYEEIARFMKDNGDMSIATKLAELRLRPCTTASTFINAQFNHYKATDYADSLRRNNTRQSILAVGASLVSCLQGVLATMTGIKSVAGVRLVNGVITSALDASMSRRDCYLINPPGGGCGRLNEDLGVTEDHGNDKAAQELARVTAPLTGLARQAVAFLVLNKEAGAETPLMTLLLRSINASKNYVDAKFNELKATDYMDPVRRNNQRGALIAVGQQMVAGFRNARPTTAAGRTLLRTAAQAALQKSKEREACYRAGAGGCDRQWGTWTEPSGGEKADQELAEITNPMLGLLADRSAAGLAGLGDDVEILGMSRYAWGVALGVVGGAYALGAFDRKPVRNSRRRRRTSRRLSA
jgi:hypothetical protein